jgi:hypothetical protein
MPKLCPRKQRSSSFDPLPDEIAYIGTTVCVSQDPSTKRRHPRGYIEFLEQHNNSLENHVALLEQTLQKHHPDLDLDALDHGAISTSNNSMQHEDDTFMAGYSSSSAFCFLASLHDRVLRSLDEDVETALPRPISSPQEVSQTRDHAAENGNTSQVVDDLSNLELLCLRSAGAEPHYFGASSAYSFTKMFSASLRAVRKQAPGLTMSGIMDQSCESRPSATPAPLPNRTVVNMLTTAYFEQVHPQFPFLHRPTYLRWEEEVLAASEAGNTPNPKHAFFVFAVGGEAYHDHNPALTILPSYVPSEH